METNLSFLAKINLLKTKMEGINIAMLTTQEPDNILRSRPMHLAHFDENGSLWFFTNEYTPKATDVILHPDVNLAFTDISKQMYVSISGEASVTHDVDKMKMLWNPMIRAWFPKGLDDPNLALISVNIRQAEYWDAPASKMAQMIQAVKNAITGDEIGEHVKLDF